jgi:hypothetical protein
MKKGSIIKVVMVAVTVVGIAAALKTAQAQQLNLNFNRPYNTPVALNSTQECVIPKVDGERVPFPLQKANTKFELAEGETYLLNGTLIVSGGKVFLKVDFATQPWLATDKMVAFPYFEVSSIDVSTARQYTGKIVQVAVVTKKDDTQGTSRTADLRLNSILPPVLNNY